MIRQLYSDIEKPGRIYFATLERDNKTNAEEYIISEIKDISNEYGLPEKIIWDEVECFSLGVKHFEDIFRKLGKIDLNYCEHSYDVYVNRRSLKKELMNRYNKIHSFDGLLKFIEKNKELIDIYKDSKEQC